MIDWQKVSKITKGVEVGELRIIAMQRQAGKSMLAQYIMKMKFTSAWTKWKGEWSWKPLVSSISGKIIWGNIMVRENKFILNNYGRRIIERATPKEALTQQREEFKGILSRG